MIGAIIGDITGSVREFTSTKLRSRDQVVLLPEDGFFTDDTVMTCAVAGAVMNYQALPPEEQTEDAFKTDLVRLMQSMGRQYPGRGYGGRFAGWLLSGDPRPYNSLGNGSAMRVSAISLLSRSREECETLARWSAEVTHNHPEGVKGAVCAALVGYLARSQKDKAALREAAAAFYPELKDPDFTVAQLYKTYYFTEWCQHTVPQALECFFEADSFEDAVINCIYIGGDCDTTGAIAGGAAEAYFGVPEALVRRTMEILRRDRAQGPILDLLAQCSIH